MRRKIYKCLIKKIILKFSNYLITKKYLCRLEEINLLKKFIIIHCRGIYTSIKLSFDEIIKDVTILANFSPKHTSWIGYYYGLYYNNLLIKKKSKSVPFNICQIQHSKKCNLIMVTRNGYLLFSDSDSHVMQCMDPIHIMQNNSLISKFDPIQACYIGILSGISTSKKRLNETDPNNHI